MIQFLYKVKLINLEIVILKIKFQKMFKNQNRFKNKKSKTMKQL